MLYVGQDQNDFTAPHVFSITFNVSGPVSPTTTTTTTVPTTTTTTPTGSTTTTTAGTTPTTVGGTTTTSSVAGATTTTTTTGPAIKANSTVAAGGTLAISGTGFAANAALQVQLPSTTGNIATVTADAAGAFDTSVTIPATTDPGTHTITIGEASGADQAQITITVSAPGATTSTGADTSTTITIGETLSVTGANARPTMAIGLALLIVGLLVVAVGWPEGTSREP